MRPDPRIRQTWNQISQNLESANESAQVNLFTFSQQVIHPCFASVRGCFQSATAPCLLSREERLRRGRGRTRGRAEYSFDFYDDWENEDFAGDGLLGWGNGELDRLLTGSGAHTAAAAAAATATATATAGAAAGDARQPGRQRAMSYGSRRERPARIPGGRRTPGAPSHESAQDRASMFGFFGRLPWQVGGKGLRYQPSAADLQERSAAAAGRLDTAEAEPLLEDNEEAVDDGRKKGRQRPRSNTTGADSVTDSIRSRADLFPSEDEADAVPLDDEFAIGLERRTTTGSDTNSHGRDRSQGQASLASWRSARTQSSQETRDSEKRKRRSSVSTGALSERTAAGVLDAGVPSLEDLKREEDQVRREEEDVVERKRAAASRLALTRGLSVDDDSSVPSGISSPNGATSVVEPRAPPPASEPPPVPVPVPDIVTTASGSSKAQSNDVSPSHPPRTLGLESTVSPSPADAPESQPPKASSPGPSNSPSPADIPESQPPKASGPEPISSPSPPPPDETDDDTPS